MLEYDFESLGRALDNVYEEVPDALKISMERALRYLWQQLPPYPPQQRRELPRRYLRVTKDGRLYRSKFKTLEQQLYFFAALAAGEIQIPYRRTGTLQRQIYTRAEMVSRQEVIGHIGNNVEYAAEVIGNDSQQAEIHKGVWWQLEKEVDANIDGATEVLIKTAWEQIEAAWERR